MLKKEAKIPEKRGQIWIETVIYTLIALTLIGAVLAFAAPKINEIRDRAVIEQTITMMQNINARISSVVDGGVGNKRVIEIGIKKGSLKIDSENDLIVFEVQSLLEYSEEGERFNIGDISAITEEQGSGNKITFTSNYSEYDLTYNGLNELKTITSSTTPYKLSIENKGGVKTIVDIIIS